MSRKHTFIKGSSAFCQLIIENPWFFIASLYYYVVVCAMPIGSLAKARRKATQKPCDSNSNISHCRQFVDVELSLFVVRSKGACSWNVMTGTRRRSIDLTFTKTIITVRLRRDIRIC